LLSRFDSPRASGGGAVPRHELYLVEIISSQELARRKSIEVFDEGAAKPGRLTLFRG
jgi:hypothetical protein